MKKIAVTKTGYNALKNTDPDKFVYSSEYDTLKYDTTGTIEMTVNFADYYDTDPSPGFPIPDLYYHKKIVEVTHSIGYVPYFAVYVVDSPASGQSIQIPLYVADFTTYTYLGGYTDTTKLYFTYVSRNTLNSGTGTVDFNYRIFKNDLNI